MRTIFPQLLFILLITFVFTVKGQTSITEVKPQIRAVIVGISKYEDSTNIENLKFAAKDARDYYKFLTQPEGGSVPEANIALLTDKQATRANIIRAITNKFRPATDKDMLIFYFSGHGEIGQYGSGYLSTYDLATDNIEVSGIPMNSLDDYFRNAAKMKLTIIDACHAGLQTRARGFKGSKADNNEKFNMSISDYLEHSIGGNLAILSSQDRQESQESDLLKNGVFTYYLLKGLRGEADQVLKDSKDDYQNNRVTAKELTAYLNLNVPDFTHYAQVPTFKGSYESDFVLSKVVGASSATGSKPPRINNGFYNLELPGEYDDEESNKKPFIQFTCPTDTVSKELTLEINIPASVNLEDICYLEIVVQEFIYRTADSSSSNIHFDKLFIPRYGINRVKVPNYLLKHNQQLRVGYVLRSQAFTRRFDGIICETPLDPDRRVKKP